ncbi:hypothetical protein [Streptomyces sp. NRRL S-237]|uniref:hypothetical protein n=1 Tax=Streptomyces sp. NRRL S-237 TaxID=1463895 RepID=UPI0004C94154|nr:hypothetical protein [Streptomyces sp. NRRL S-237]
MTFSTTAKSFRLGTRPSPMAMEQTGRFARALRLQYPDLDLEVLEITSEGDQHRGPLAEIGGKGAFTRRADQYLLDGGIEATIACAKDIPGPHDRAPGIIAGAVLPREDVADVLVFPVKFVCSLVSPPGPSLRRGHCSARVASSVGQVSGLSLRLWVGMTMPCLAL